MTEFPRETASMPVGSPGSEDTPSALVEVVVRAVASGGDGVADLPDGRVVFVPRTVPGDRVRVAVVEDHGSWARASVAEMLEAGEDRVEAACPLFDRCGGCQLQHLAYERQLHWKGRFVVDALERIGKLGDVAAPEVVASPSREGYRSRMTFTLRRLRGGRIVAGLHSTDNAAHVVDVRGECVLPRPEIGAAWLGLRRAWGSGARRLPDGGRLRLTLRSAPEGVELVVIGGAPGWRAGGLADEVPNLTGIWHRPSGGEAAALVAGEPRAGGGDAFEQVNPEGADLLRRHVLDVAEAATPSGVVEAYCGTGGLGRALASAECHVTGIERNESAVEGAQAGAPEGFAVRLGAVEDHLADLLPVDLLIVNPPRSGLDDRIPPMIVAAPPRQLIYVSCDPATLARDLGRLKEAFELMGLRCFDLFPHTSHVETVAVLQRREAT
ncbi:MAG: class I SAM-dependent RNA methyltransferase [Gemmatimonadetes bacterium]|nr:class I SAM-dependent RNA methyltransferase [Gemmatimonadota bacterium]